MAELYSFSYIEVCVLTDAGGPILVSMCNSNLCRSWSRNRHLPLSCVIFVILRSRTVRYFFALTSITPTRLSNHQPKGRNYKTCKQAAQFGAGVDLLKRYGHRTATGWCERGPASQGQSASRVDNTNINARDKDGASKTPQDQSNRAQDRALLAAVRRAIVADKSLSTMAQNVNILVEDGAVTLRGPVKSASEKAKVDAHTKSVKGITTTDNQLHVKADGATQT